MKISNIILPGTLAKLKTTAYGYKITNCTDNTEAYISREGNPENRTFIPYFVCDNATVKPVNEIFTDLTDAVKWLETKINLIVPSN